MMLRLGMRMTKVDLASAQDWAEKAAAAGVMTSVADNAFIIHDASGGRPTVNRISQVFQSNGGERAQVKWSNTFIDFLTSTNDPRLPVLAEVAPVGGSGDPDYTYGSFGDNTPGIQIGMPNGYDIGAPVDVATEPNYPGPVGADAVGAYSRPRPYLLRLNSPTFIMNYGEVELLLAEAKFRGFNVPGTAQEHYKAGIVGAMLSLAQYDAAAAIDPTVADDYADANPLVNGTELEQINTQYWAATILNDYESFANWRRSGFPVLTPVNHPNGNTGGVIPRRMLYPVAEAANNKTNYEAAIARLGGADNVLARVWWDE
jgi:hypothetical protein